MFGHAVGFFLFAWMIFTMLMFNASLKSSVALSGVFFWLSITFMLLGINEFTTGGGAGIAGGAFGLITAFNAWYVALGKPSTLAHILDERVADASCVAQLVCSRPTRATLSSRPETSPAATETPNQPKHGWTFSEHSFRLCWSVYSFYDSCPRACASPSRFSRRSFPKRPHTAACDATPSIILDNHNPMFSFTVSGLISVRLAMRFSDGPCSLVSQS